MNPITTSPLYARLSLTLSLSLGLGGCQADLAMNAPSNTRSLSVPRYDIPVIDTVNPAKASSWQAAPVVALALDAGQPHANQPPTEQGQGRMFYDDHAIYLRVDFVDRDVCTLATEDHETLYSAGDIAEWFIGTPVGPNGEPGVYLELHVAPNGVRSAYRIDRPGLIEPLSTIPFTAEVTVDGTLNDPRDTDIGWNALLTLPWSDLRQLSPAFADLGPDLFKSEQGSQSSATAISVLIARYNYGRHLPYTSDGAGGPELTMWPRQPKLSFHLRPLHALLR